VRLSERLLWAFAILFLLCGVPLLFLDREAPDPVFGNTLAGMAALFLGGFEVCLAWNALDTGEIKLQHFRCSRAAQPRCFAAAVVVILAAGLATLFTAVWFFFLK
jgi:hypothetical protein